jgi:hypothetical protein
MDVTNEHGIFIGTPMAPSSFRRSGIYDNVLRKEVKNMSPSTTNMTPSTTVSTPTPSTPAPAPSAATPAAPAPAPAAPVQSEASKIIGLLFTAGVGAAAIFVKNPNHQQTAANIITVLQDLLPELEALL